MTMINRQGVGRSLLFCGLAWVVSCSSDKHEGFIRDGIGGSSTAGNRSGTGGASHAGAGGRGGANNGAETSGEAGAAGDSSLAPSVEITSPTAVADPNKGAVITDSQA